MAEHFLPGQHLQLLMDCLKDDGYGLIGPKIKDDAIVFEELADASELPYGIEENTAPGRYQLQKARHKRAFSFNTGPQGLKPFLFAPEQELWRAEHTENGLVFKQSYPLIRPLAFIGLRACDLAALALQDQHFAEGPYPDPAYQAKRQQLFIVAVNCSRSASTCFCVSTGDGPNATSGYDLCLDELDSGYLVSVGSDKGQRIADKLPVIPATAAKRAVATRQHRRATHQQLRQMPDDKTLMRLVDKLDDQRWQLIAERCLACGNCTSVCPTCFCSKQESQSDIKGQSASQVRVWDSCFTEQHSYIVGKVIRHEISQRYRQWVLHKLANWQQQYGRSGCVGCGRCIAWCPVAIDLVEEARALCLGDLP